MKNTKNLPRQLWRRLDAKSRMRRNEIAYLISMKFRTIVGTPDIITCANFGDNRLRGLEVTGVSNFPIFNGHASLSLKHLAYYTVASEHCLSVSTTQRLAIGPQSETMAI